MKLKCNIRQVSMTREVKRKGKKNGMVNDGKEMDVAEVVRDMGSTETTDTVVTAGKSV